MTKKKISFRRKSKFWAKIKNLVKNLNLGYFESSFSLLRFLDKLFIFGHNLNGVKKFFTSNVFY